MNYIWDEKELIQILVDHDEYAQLVDAGDFDTLRRYLRQDGYEVAKTFLDTVLVNAGIDINDGIARAIDMKYTIVGTEDSPYNNKPRYRYAGLTSKNEPAILGMGDVIWDRVFFTDYSLAEAFFNAYMECPKVKNRRTPVHWKIIPVTQRSMLGKYKSKGAKMKLVHSSIGDCYQIDRQEWYY